MVEVINNVIDSSSKSPLIPIVKYAGPTCSLSKKPKSLDTSVTAWSTRILSQGPWDPSSSPVSNGGPRSLPMPVEISSYEELEPFFNHLSDSTVTTTDVGWEEGEEPHYKQKMKEFVKGVEFEDGRMDLCKMSAFPTRRQPDLI
jgi:hypothetical protein